MTVSAVESWNKIQKQLGIENMLLKDLFPNKIKTVVTNFYNTSCKNVHDSINSQTFRGINSVT